VGVEAQQRQANSMNGEGVRDVGIVRCYWPAKYAMASSLSRDCWSIIFFGFGAKNSNGECFGIADGDAQ